MSKDTTTQTNLAINSIKPIELKEHGNYIYGTLDGIDFTASGIIQETKQPYGASLRLKFIIKSTAVKELNGIKIPYLKAITQVMRLPTTDTKLPELVQKYSLLVGKDLLINYSLKDGTTHTIDNEDEIVVLN